MTAKIMKEIEAIKVTLATLMAIKLDWRLAMAVLGTVLAFFYAEMKEVRQELSEIKILLQLNLAQQGGGNFTIDEATLRAIMHPTSPASDATGGLPITPIYVYVDSDACYITETHPLIATPNTQTQGES